MLKGLCDIKPGQQSEKKKQILYTFWKNGNVECQTSFEKYVPTLHYIL